MNEQKRAIFEDVPDYAKLIIALIVIALSFFILSLLGVIVAIPLFGIGLSELVNIANLENVKILKYLQLVQSVGLFILPPFIIGYLFSRHSFSFLKLNIKPKQKSVIAIIILMIAAIPAINLFAQANIMLLDSIFSPNNWMKEMEELALKTTEAFLNADSVLGLMANILIIAIIPAIGEELIFRGILQKIFINWTRNIHFSVIFTAIIFSGFHFQFYGFLPRFLLGVLFGYLFVWSKTIWLPIIAHFVNNGFAVIISYFISRGNIPKDIENVGMDSSTIIYAIISLVIAFLLIRFVLKEEKRDL